MRNKVLAKFSSIPLQLHFLHHEFVIPRECTSHLTSVGLFAEISAPATLARPSVRQVVRPPPSIPPHQKVQQAKGEGGRATSSIHPRTISANLRALQRDPTADIERRKGP